MSLNCEGLRGLTLQNHADLKIELDCTDFKIKEWGKLAVTLLPFS